MKKSDNVELTPQVVNDILHGTEHLESLGCTDINTHADLFIDFEAPDGQMCNIGLYDFDNTYDLPKILSNAQKYTCCGDLIDYDGDSDLCPTCHEHC